MRRIRVIPVLLMQNGGLVKSERFKDHKYVGDPINAVKIFNEKEVDEIVLLDISASREKRAPDMEQIGEIVSEAFMPMAYGGGITTVQQVRQLINAGVEKVVINSAALQGWNIVREAADIVGSQSVVVCIDVKKNWLGKYKVMTQNGSTATGDDPVSFAKKAAAAGAGEIIIQSIDKDGTFGGYDLSLVRMVSTAVDIPVVAMGGAGNISDFIAAVNHGASAVAAGSMFVFQRPHKAVLISYPSQKELKESFKAIHDAERSNHT